MTNKKDKIFEFQEKPPLSISNLASMNIYIFNYKTLRKALIKESQDKNSSHDFGKNIIPILVAEGKKLISYKYQYYLKNVGSSKLYICTILIWT